jgi:hypothetical protein
VLEASQGSFDALVAYYAVLPPDINTPLTCPARVHRERHSSSGAGGSRRVPAAPMDEPGIQATSKRLPSGSAK